MNTTVHIIGQQASHSLGAIDATLTRPAVNPLKPYDFAQAVLRAENSSETIVSAVVTCGDAEEKSTRGKGDVPQKRPQNSLEMPKEGKVGKSRGDEQAERWSEVPPSRRHSPSNGRLRSSLDHKTYHINDCHRPDIHPAVDDKSGLTEVEEQHNGLEQADSAESSPLSFRS